MAAFSDDELAAFYREIEWRTAANPSARSPRRNPAGRAAPPECPTPDKNVFFTRAEALSAVDRAAHHHPRGPELRTYRCVCGRWHITSSSPRPPAASADRTRTRRRSRRKGKRK